MNISQIMDNCTSAQKVEMILEEYLPAIKSEANFYAGIRFAQFKAYQDAGFTAEQSMQLMAMPRVQI
jgi:hypothetical protein